VIRLLTAGESHGPSLSFILEGLPAGLRIDMGFVKSELARRQRGHGRGGRMKIESDSVEFTAGIRKGVTLGSPVCGLIRNLDYDSWRHVMPVDADGSSGAENGGDERPVFTPRPGHADLPGAVKYGFSDARNVLERASARETAARVAAGALCKLLLAEFGVSVYSHVVAIGGVTAVVSTDDVISNYAAVEASPVRCADADAALKMIRRIDAAAKEGDSLGGIFEVVATGVPVGLGSHVHFDRRLDARLAGAIVSIPGVKGVEFGMGFSAASMKGSEVHDEIEPWPQDERGYRRLTNNAGGIEGGISNGEPILVRGAMKPIPTLRKPLRTVDLRGYGPATAATERSDVCAVPSAAIVAEAMVSLELARACCEKFGGDSVDEIRRRFRCAATESRTGGGELPG